MTWQRNHKTSQHQIKLKQKYFREFNKTRTALIFCGALRLKFLVHKSIGMASLKHGRRCYLLLEMGLTEIEHPICGATGSINGLSRKRRALA